jgi:acylphosphatase
MSNLASLHATVHGHVQGVYFRAFVERQALSLGLTGYVCNLPSGDAVEVWVEGERSKLDNLLKQLHIGPPHAKVTQVTTEWLEPTGKFSNFRIRYF